MNNDQNKGVTGVAKTGTGILGNTVSGLSNTVGGAVGMSLNSFFFFFLKAPLFKFPCLVSGTRPKDVKHVRLTYMGPIFL